MIFSPSANTLPAADLAAQVMSFCGTPTLSNPARGRRSRGYRSRTACGAAASASNPSRNRQRRRPELPIRQPERVAINRSKGLKDSSEQAKVLSESGKSKSISCPGDCAQGPGRNKPIFLLGAGPCVERYRLLLRVAGEVT